MWRTNVWIPRGEGMGWGGDWEIEIETHPLLTLCIK